MKKIPSSFLICFSLSFMPGLAQESENDTLFRVFELGEVSIFEDRKLPGTSELSREEIRKLNHTDLARTVSEFPGIIFSHTGSRNENSVLVRGFDSRQVPLLIDGIPVYISYDGSIDLSRFLSWDYRKISVSKGFTSLLYGPNTMGGSINLVTSVPTRKFQADASAGAIAGNKGYNGHMENITVGSAGKRFFLQTSFSNYNLDKWDLSRRFDPQVSEAGGNRGNSFEEDRSVNLRFGFTPAGEDKYVITFLRQDGSKGIPVYDGVIQQQRWWKMPEWDKSSLYFNSSTRINANNTLIARLYYDSFYNLLESYDDSTYSSQEFRYAFSSIYDDESYGGSIQLTNRSLGRNTAGLAIHFKRDIHSEQGDTGLPFLNFSDNTGSVALENKFEAKESFTLVGGLSLNYRNNTGAEEYFSSSDSIGNMPSSGDAVLNYRLGTYYIPSERVGIWIAHSMNSRFATLKERYSYRLGRSLPNPELGSEKAWHFILGGKISHGIFNLQSEVFYSHSRDRISYVNVDPELLQYRNIERTNSYGADINFEIIPNDRYRIVLDYGYLQLNNPDSPEFEYIDIPEHSMGILCEGRVFKGLYLNLRYTYFSERASYSDGSFFTDGFGLTNMNVKFKLNSFLTLDLSVQNLLDVDYLYAEGYPARGRNFRAALRFTYP